MSNNKNELYIKPEKQLSKRLLALDAARGLAVVGMFVQHFALNQRNSFVSGNTMILFILCSGISYSIMSQSMKARGIEPAAFRSRLLARSVFIDFVGYVLIMLNGPFGMVLSAYAMLFILSIPLVHYSARTLIVISGVLFLVGPPLMLMGLSLFAHTALLGDIAGGPGSALAWAPVFIAGMAIGKMDLYKFKTAIKFVVTGLVILIPSKLTALFLLPEMFKKCENWLLQFPTYAKPSQIDQYAIWPLNTQPIQWQMLFLDSPQCCTAFELLIGLGGTLTLFGLLLLIENKFKAVLRSFAATGRVALTLYVTQFVLVWGITLIRVDLTSFDIGAIPFGDIIVAVSTLLIGWLLSKLTNGPLEGAIRRFEGLFYKN